MFSISLPQGDLLPIVPPVKNEFGSYCGLPLVFRTEQELMKML